MGTGHWGLGTGDWALGTRDWGLRVIRGVPQLARQAVFPHAIQHGFQANRATPPET